MTLRVGDLLYGTCGGAFEYRWPDKGRRVEALGADWVVVRAQGFFGDSHRPDFAYLTPETLEEYKTETEFEL